MEYYLVQYSRNQIITTPLSPPSQGGDKGEVENLLKTCPHENRERSFYRGIP